MAYRRRSDCDCAKITLLTVSGVEYSNLGYAADLQYYQGAESIYKAKELAARMPDDKGRELVDFIRESNERMEKQGNEPLCV